MAIDRGIRLADKRSLPCPRRNEWLLARDELYEEIMQRAWDAKRGYFAQSYLDEENGGEQESILDSAVLIMPLVFFCAAVRFLLIYILTQAGWFYLLICTDMGTILI